jgi:single-strand DNA-binding protein
MNNYTAIGRLYAQTETKFFESGSILSEFTLVISKRPYTDNNGNPVVPAPVSVPCKYWHKSANLAEYLQKGKQIGISGELETERWVDRATGGNRSKMIVKVNNLELLASPKGETVEAPVDEVETAETVEADVLPY